MKIRNFLKLVASEFYTQKNYVFNFIYTSPCCCFSFFTYSDSSMWRDIIIGYETKFDLTRARKFTKTKFCCSQTIAFGDLHLVS